MKTEKQSCCCFCFNIASEGHIVHLDILDLLKFLTVNINTSALENSTVCDGCLNSILEICEYKKRNSSKMLVETKQEIDSETSVICQKCKTVCEQGNTIPLVDCVTQIDWSDFVTYLFTDQDSQLVKSLQVCVSCRISVSNIQDFLKSIYIYDLSKMKCDVDHYDSITTGNKNSVEEKVEIKQEFENFIVNDATKVNIMEVDKRELEDCKTELLDISYKSYADFKCKNEEVDLKLEYDYDDNQSTDRYEKVNVGKEISSGSFIEEDTHQGVNFPECSRLTYMKVWDNTGFICTYCSKEFNKKLHLYNHLVSIHKCKDRTASNLLRYKCQNCDYASRSKSNLIRHVKMHYNIRDFKCTYCSQEFVNKSRLDDHLLKIHKCRDSITSTIHECDNCSYSTTNKSVLLRHKLTHGINVEGLEKYKCQNCMYESFDKSSLMAHIKIHNNIRDFKCTLCSRNFTQRRYLDDHLLKFHRSQDSVTSKIHECDNCSYSSTNKCNLLRHTVKHGVDIGFEKYKCQHCIYETYDKSSLIKHIKMHNNVRDFKCTLCSKNFTQKEALDGHLLKVHKNKDSITSKIHECDQCSYETTKKSNLLRHKLRHEKLQDSRTKEVIHIRTDM